MKHTPLFNEHEALGAKICPFAGYAMPIQYADGIKQEHLHVREACGIFDVSHMGQCILKGDDVTQLLQQLTPTRFDQVAEGQAKYTVLTNAEGGIIDDLIVTRLTDKSFFLVINAACKEKDITWITEHLSGNQTLEEFPDRALIAVQGPGSSAVLNRLLTSPISDLAYMHLTTSTLRSNDLQITISRTGYTGEDGFEISLPGEQAPAFWQELIAQPEVKPIGLGARDSLRLEAGYPLYGHDLDDSTSPVEAGIGWTVSKATDEYEPSFAGSQRVLAEKAKGASRKRVGVQLLDKGIAREGMAVLSDDQKPLGTLSSGGFSPTLGVSIGMAYLPTAQAQPGTTLYVDVRGRKLAAQVTAMPFITTRAGKSITQSKVA